MKSPQHFALVVLIREKTDVKRQMSHVTKGSDKAVLESGSMFVALKYVSTIEAKVTYE